MKFEVDDKGYIKMKFEVDDNVMQLLSGDTLPGYNYAVALYEGTGTKVIEVSSIGFNSKALEDMFALAMTDMNSNHKFTVSLRQKTEHLFGVQVRSKISLDALEALTKEPPELGCHSVAIRLFGKNQPTAGSVIRLTDVVVYPILVALTATTTYNKMEIDFY